MIDMKFRRKGPLGKLKIIREAFEIQMSSMRRMRKRGTRSNPRALQMAQGSTTAEPPLGSVSRERRGRGEPGR